MINDDGDETSWTSRKSKQVIFNFRIQLLDSYFSFQWNIKSLEVNSFSIHGLQVPKYYYNVLAYSFSKTSLTCKVTCSTSITLPTSIVVELVDFLILVELLGVQHCNFFHSISNYTTCNNIWQYHINKGYEIGFLVKGL